jgi:hypothetical protein
MKFVARGTTVASFMALTLVCSTAARAGVTFDSASVNVRGYAYATNGSFGEQNNIDSTNSTSSFSGLPLTSSKSVSAYEAGGVNLEGPSSATDFESGQLALVSPSSGTITFSGAATAITGPEGAQAQASNLGGDAKYYFSVNAPWNFLASATTQESYWANEGIFGIYKTDGSIALRYNFTTGIFSVNNILPGSYYLDAFVSTYNDYADTSADTGTPSGNHTEVLNFAITSAVPPVPEPATWSMMISGIGLIGFAAHRRRDVGLTYA